MSTTTTAPSLRKPRAAEGAIVRRALAALIVLMLMPGTARGESRIPVMLMTGLPLVWGEKGPFEPGSRPAAAYVELSEEFDFRPVDVLDSATLKRGRWLFLAQPKRLAPVELAALDKWIRNGGRALILTDPMLTWPSVLPPGDIRRPPPVGLLSPLLDHWRVTLEAPAEPGEVEALWDGRRIRLDSPGRLRSSSPDCVVAQEGWRATCNLGRGVVTLVADADLMRDSLWAPNGPQRRTADNPAVVGEWLDELAQVSRPRPRPAPASGNWARSGALPLALLALLAAGSGIGLLLRRRRRR
jgi:hypothetical protein